MPWEFDFLTEVAFIHKDLKTRRLKNNLLHMEVMRIRVIRFLFTSQDTRHIGGIIHISEVLWELDFLDSGTIVTPHFGERDRSRWIVQWLDMKGTLGSAHDQVPSAETLDFDR